jgi:hypothetical protein
MTLYGHFPRFRIAIFGEIYRRSQSRFWLYETYGRGEVIRLESIGIGLAIETLYESVAIPCDTVG